MLLIEDKHSLAGLHLQYLVRGAWVPGWLLAQYHLLYTLRFHVLLPPATLPAVLLSLAGARVLPVWLGCWGEP